MILEDTVYKMSCTDVSPDRNVWCIGLEPDTSSGRAAETYQGVCNLNLRLKFYS